MFVTFTARSRLCLCFLVCVGGMYGGGVIIGSDSGLLEDQGVGELLCVVDVLAGGQGGVRGQDLSQRSGC